MQSLVLDLEGGLDAVEPPTGIMIRAYDQWCQDYYDCQGVEDNWGSTETIRRLRASRDASKRSFENAPDPAVRGLDAARRLGERVEQWLSTTPIQ